VTSEGNYLRCLGRQRCGDEDHRRIGEIWSGDLLIFYLKGVRKLGAVALATRPVYRSAEATWPDREYPYRVDNEFLSAAWAPADAANRVAPSPSAVKGRACGALRTLDRLGRGEWQPAYGRQTMRPQDQGRIQGAPLPQRLASACPRARDPAVGSPARPSEPSGGPRAGAPPVLAVRRVVAGVRPGAESIGIPLGAPGCHDSGQHAARRSAPPALPGQHRPPTCPSPPVRGTRIPHGSLLSPDAARMPGARRAALTPKQQESFVPLCPDAVLIDPQRRVVVSATSRSAGIRTRAQVPVAGPADPLNRDGVPVAHVPHIASARGAARR
jgi:hypothetical protein